MTIGFSVASHGSKVIAAASSKVFDSDFPLVSFYRRDGDFAILMGRLYYRCQLVVEVEKLVPAEIAMACKNSDAALAFAAHHAWSTEAFERLEGDYCLVIWSAKTRQFVGARDPLGGYPLFWVKTDSLVAFSTSLRELLPLLSQRSLNVEYLADLLMVPGPVNERSRAICVYEGIHRVVAGDGGDHRSGHGNGCTADVLGLA